MSTDRKTTSGTSLYPKVTYSVSTIPSSVPFPALSVQNCWCLVFEEVGWGGGVMQRCQWRHARHAHI